MSIKFFARNGYQMGMSCILWLIIMNCVSFSSNTAAAQCPTKNRSLSTAEFSLKVEEDQLSNGKEATVSFYLDGDQSGQDFPDFYGLDLILEFNESLASLANSQFEFDQCWLDQPSDFSQTIEVVGTHKLRIHLNNTNCTPAKGTGLLAKIRLIHKGSGFNWAAIKLADGGILIEDIFPAKMHPGEIGGSTPSLKVFTLANRQFQLGLDHGKIQSVTILNTRAEVLSKYSQDSQETVQLDLQGYSSGIYILVVKTESGSLLRHKIVLY